MKWKLWIAKNKVVKKVEQRLRECIVRQLPQLGEVGLNASIETLSDYNVKIITSNVVLDLSYDWRDRYLGARYRSLKGQVEFEHAEGFERLRLYDYGDSPFNLLRDRGFPIDGSVEVNEPEALDAWMATFFEALRDHASDILRGEAEGIGCSRTPPSPIKIWQRIDS